MSTKRMTVAEMEEEAQRLKNPETLVGQLYEAPDAVPRKKNQRRSAFACRRRWSRS